MPVSVWKKKDLHYCSAAAFHETSFIMFIACVSDEIVSTEFYSWSTTKPHVAGKLDMIWLVYFCNHGIFTLCAIYVSVELNLQLLNGFGYFL